MVICIGLQPDGPVSRHRITGVAKKIEKDFLKLYLISLDDRKFRRDSGSKFNVCFGAGSGKGQTKMTEKIEGRKRRTFDTLSVVIGRKLLQLRNHTFNIFPHVIPVTEIPCLRMLGLDQL